MSSRFGGPEMVRGHAAMLAFSALVAGSFTLGSLAANRMDPLAFTTLRFLIAAVAVGITGALTRSIKLADARAPWRYLLLGTVFSSYFVLMFEGLKTADPISASAVMTLMPVMTAGFAWVVLKQVTTLRIAAALAVGAVGALWVIFQGDPERLLALQVGRGEVIYFLGCVSHSLYVPLVRKLSRGEGALSASFFVLLAGALVMALYGFPVLIATDYAGQPPITWIALVYTAIGASAVTFVLLNFASVRLAGAKVMAYTYLTPGWVILWEVAFGHGLPPLRTLAGLAISAVAIFMLLKHES